MRFWSLVCECWCKIRGSLDEVVTRPELFNFLCAAGGVKHDPAAIAAETRYPNYMKITYIGAGVTSSNF